ncbi:MAG TPA: methyltransferase domain-containing protein [Opitutaceae bacterium]
MPHSADMIEEPPQAELHERRVSAAAASGGTSPDAILATVLNLLPGLGAHGDLLEFGAGTARLARAMAESGRFRRLVCADLLPRPASLQPSIEWLRADLNDPVRLPAGSFDTIVSTEVIEHLESPRAVFREFHRLLRPNGLLVLTTPNQESLRSYCALIGSGHFAGFLGQSYPAHITALLRLDLVRIGRESGFGAPGFFYTNSGGLPKFPHVSWQRVSAGLLRGRLFSDNVAAALRKPTSPPSR